MSKFFDKKTRIEFDLEVDSNGNVCPYFILETHLASQLCAYTSMMRDLGECLVVRIWLNENEEAPKLIRKHALFSVISLYIRCFNSAHSKNHRQGRGVRLDAKHIFQERPKLFEAHQKLMEIRNSFIAHACDEEYDNFEHFIFLNPDTENKSVHTRKNIYRRMVNHSFPIELFSFVHDYVMEKHEKLDNKVKQEVENMDINSIYNKAIKPQTNEC